MLNLLHRTMCTQGVLYVVLRNTLVYVQGNSIMFNEHIYNQLNLNRKKTLFKMQITYCSKNIFSRSPKQ